MVVRAPPRPLGGDGAGAARPGGGGGGDGLSSWRERTFTSSRAMASMPWTAAASACTVVRHGTARET
ncbi:hypothetical protein, partial [Streptomyces albus]|uniref:hypothetical protein n=1 Tax=Streptomyces albus TaxID=1888 RepID=UPI001B80518E